MVLLWPMKFLWRLLSGPVVAYHGSIVADECSVVADNGSRNT